LRAWRAILIGGIIGGLIGWRLLSVFNRQASWLSIAVLTLLGMTLGAAMQLK